MGEGKGRLFAPDAFEASIVDHGGIQPLIELCKTGDSFSHAASACTLKNISTVREVRQSLTEKGAVKVTIDLLECGILLGTKEYAAECLQNLTASNKSLRRIVISEGGIRSSLAYLDNTSLPQESPIAALRNLVNSVSMETLVSSGFFPRIVHVLKSGSLGAQQAAASAICRVCVSNSEMKKLVGEARCIPLLIKLLEAKSNGAREASAQAISSLMTVSQNTKEVKKDFGRSVLCLVQLLEASPQYAVVCLSGLSSTKKCRKMMVSYGASGYLKKLIGAQTMPCVTATFLHIVDPKRTHSCSLSFDLLKIGLPLHALYKILIFFSLLILLGGSDLSLPMVHLFIPNN